MSIAFEEVTGKKSGTGTIYVLLKRHGWRSILKKINKKYQKLVLEKNKRNRRNKHK